MTGTLPGNRKCLGCNVTRATYRIGPALSDRACGECIRAKRVPVVPSGPIKRR